MERFSDVTKAVVTIGAWHPGDSTVVDAITAAEFKADQRLGVCAELCGIQLDQDGEPVTTALSERIIGIPVEQLREVDEIIAVAYGSSKAVAVRAAVRGGFVTSLITHTSVAERLLEL
jgi:DNA-binding transcriptional regulator LsrR (DeoR family)